MHTNSLSIDQQNDWAEEELDQQVLHMQSGVGLQIKTAGVRKIKRHPFPKLMVNLVRTGTCQPLSDRTAQLLRRIVSRLALNIMCEEERPQRAWNYRIFSATMRDKPTS